MHKKNDWNILKDLQKHDEIKFVIGNYEDYEWTKNKINSYNLNEKRILLSPVHDVLKSKDLSEWILKDGINARLQLQLHKYIWSPDTKGV